MFCFNSCMVQLKYDFYNVVNGDFFGFNSCMVQLK